MQTGFQTSMNISFDKTQTEAVCCCNPFYCRFRKFNPANEFSNASFSVTHRVDFEERAKSVIDIYDLGPDQIEGGSFDGACFHLGTHDHFKYFFMQKKVEIHWIYGGMDRSGLVEAHLLKQIKNDT